MTTDNPIAKHLKEYHRGELRVVPSRELEAAFQIRGPDLRRLINSLRGDGAVLVVSDDRKTAWSEALTKAILESEKAND